MLCKQVTSGFACIRSFTKVFRQIRLDIYEDLGKISEEFLVSIMRFEKVSKFLKGFWEDPYVVRVSPKAEF